MSTAPSFIRNLDSDEDFATNELSSLLALTAELEAAGSAYLAYDRDLHVGPDDADYDDAQERHRVLYGAVRTVTDLIFAHQPTTLAGVLLTAHAAVLRADAEWEEKPEHIENDGLLLRRVCNGLFRAVGVDWRGRPISDATPLAPTAPDAARDAKLIQLAEAAIAEQGTANAVLEASEYDAPRGTFDRSLRLLERVTALDARSPAGLAAKAQLLLNHITEGDEFEGDVRCEALAFSIARDAVRLGAGGPAGTEAPDPILVAISNTCATLKEHLDACLSPDAETPEGDARRTAAGAAAYAAWQALMVTRPKTIGGVQALACFVPHYIEGGGAYDDLRDQNTLFRLIAGADLPGGDPSGGLLFLDGMRKLRDARLPMAAE